MFKSNFSGHNTISGALATGFSVRHCRKCVVFLSSAGVGK